MEKRLTISQVSRTLGISERAVMDLVLAGKIEQIEGTDPILIDYQSVQAYYSLIRTDVVEITTKLNEARYKEYLRVNWSNANRKAILRLTIFFITTALLVNVFIFINVVLFTIVFSINQGAIVFVFLTAFNARKNEVEVFAKQFIETNRLSCSPDSIRHIAVDEKGLFFEETSGNSKTQSFYEWGYLFKSIETKDTFYVFVAFNSAVIIPKRDIVRGNPETVRKLLQSKLGDAAITQLK